MSSTSGSKDNKRKPIGEVTKEERDIIRGLFERKTGLAEVSRALVVLEKAELERSPLYEKVVQDLGKVTAEYQDWWNRMSKSHKWLNVEGSRWEIDFDTCKVYLQD